MATTYTISDLAKEFDLTTRAMVMNQVQKNG